MSGGAARRHAYTGSITTDRELIQIVDAALDAAARAAGAHLACYAGCAVCCFGPFPITMRDGERLREAWLTAEPALATQIAQRAQAARTRLAAAFPGDATTGLLDTNFDEAAFAAQHENLACPVLDPDSGQCSLYQARPIACRLYGLPTRVDGVDLPHCPLCFRRAQAEELEAARAIIVHPAQMRPADLRPAHIHPPHIHPAEMRDDVTEPSRTVIAYAFPSLVKP